MTILLFIIRIFLILTIKLIDFSIFNFHINIVIAIFLIHILYFFILDFISHPISAIDYFNTTKNIKEPRSPINDLIQRITFKRYQSQAINLIKIIYFFTKCIKGQAVKRKIKGMEAEH